MARNLFSQDPLERALGMEAPRVRGALAETPVAPPAAPLSLDEIASKYSLPPNLLMAVGEAAPDGLEDFAAEASRRVASGQDLREAVSVMFGPKSATIFGRANAIADERDPALKAAQEARNDNYAATDLGLQTVGSVMQGIGLVPQGVGRLVDATTLPKSGNALIDFAAQVLDQPRLLVGDIASLVGEKVSRGGDWVTRRTSDDFQQAMQDSGISGDILDPDTWSLPANPSAEGMAGLFVSVFGQMAPVVAASVFSGGTAAMLAGGAQGYEGGAQMLEADLTRMAEDGTLQQTSYYQHLIEQGATPEDAVQRTISAGTNLGAIPAAVVAAVGGKLTSGIIHRGATGAAGNMATRVVTGAGLGAVEEGTQEAVEGVAGRLVAQLVTGADMDPTQNTLSDFVMGALAGGTVGGLGGIPGGEQEPAPEAAPPDALALPAPPLALPSPDSFASSETVDPVTGEVLPPAGPLESAARMAPPPMAGQEPPVLFPDMKPGTEVTLRDPDGRDIPVVFLREEGQNVVVRDQGHELVIPASDFDVARVAAQAVEEASVPGAAEPAQERAAREPIPDIASAPLPSPSTDELIAEVIAASKPAPAPIEPSLPLVGKGAEPIHTPGLPDTVAATESELAWVRQQGPRANGGLNAMSDRIDRLTRHYLKLKAQEPADAPVRVDEPVAELPAPVPSAPPVEPAPALAAPESQPEPVPVAEETPAASVGASAEVGPVAIRNIRTKAAAITGMDQDSKPVVEGVSFVWEPKESGWIFSRKHADKVAKVLGIQGDVVPGGPALPVPDETAAPGASPDPSPGDIYRNDPERAREAEAEANLVVNKVLPGRQKAGSPIAEIKVGRTADGRFKTSHQHNTSLGGHAAGMGADFASVEEAEAHAREQILRRVRSFAGSEVKNGSNDQERKDAQAILKWLGEPLPEDRADPEPENTPDPNPTDGQKEAGNYKMGHIQWNGLDITIETAKGQERRGKDKGGKEWSVTMPADYGYIRRTEGADGDHLDVYMGPDTGSELVFVVDQINADTGAFDEHKVMLGFASEKAATDTYKAGFSDGKGADRLGALTAWSLGNFLEQVKNPDRWLSPVGRIPTPGRAQAKKRGERVVIEPVEPAPINENVNAETPAYGATNTLVSADRAAELRKRLMAKLKTQTNAGIDPEILAIGAELAVFHIEAGARKFVDLARAIAADLQSTPATLKPYLRSWYNGARDMMEDSGLPVDGMDDASTVKTILSSGAIDALAPSELPQQTPSVKGKAQPAEAANDTSRNQDPDTAALAGSVPADSAGTAGSVADDAGGRESGPGAGRDAGPDRDGADADGGLVGSGDTVPDGMPAEGQSSGVVESDPAERKGESPGNYSIPSDFPLGEGTPGQKLTANLAAIALVKSLDAENRFPTPEEQAVLARYVGWGGLSQAFDRKKAASTDQWGRAQAQLKELLTPQEYRNAMSSTRNAHYTSRAVVSTMWDAMRHFGYRGGRALEPTVGTGNFLGLQPTDMMAGTQWHASELDAITGKIAAYLFPDANVMAATGFQVAPFTDGAFDIAIGNPPFGSETITDKKRTALSGMKVHNYIIAKTGQHLRPGGVMAMVVTHRFLDTADAEARSHLAPSFKMIGAIRLPNNAFKENAGTDVVTDVVFFQKLKEGETSPRNAAWLDVNGEIEVDGQKMRVNRYYQENPSHILGRSAMDGTMYGGTQGAGEYTVHSDGRDVPAAVRKIIDEDWAGLKGILGDRSAALEAAVAFQAQSTLPIGGMILNDGQILRRDVDGPNGARVEVVTPESLWSEMAEEWQEAVTAAQAAKTAMRSPDGLSVKVIGDMLEAGRTVAYSASGGRKPKPTKAEQAVYDILDAVASPRAAWTFDAQLAEMESALKRKRLGQDRFDRLTGMLDLRNKTLNLIGAELADAKAIEQLRANLNRAYDAFVSRFGFINGSKNQGVTQGDVGVEVGLESSYQASDGKTPERAEKAAILRQRVNFPYRVAEKADTVDEGAVISMTERGKVDLAFIAGLTGKDIATVKAEMADRDDPLIFFDPAAEDWVDAETYLSGNVREKLNKAKVSGLGRNVAALEAVQPPPAPQARVTPTIRGLWLPPDVFEGFLGLLGVKSPKVSIFPESGMMLAEGTTDTLSDFGTQFLHPRRDVMSIFKAASSGKPMIVFDQVAPGKTQKNDMATKEVNALADRMGQEFKRWAYQDQERADRIVAAYNEKMNTHIERKWDGVKYLKMVGANPEISPRNTQKNGAWRMIQSKTSMMHHIVGAGKTFTAIMAVMERRRMGLSRKPMVVVPNHLVGQWASDFYALYPGAKVLAATPADFTKKNRRRLFARIATGDYDAVIIGHSSLGFIEPPAEDTERIYGEQIEALQTSIDQARASDGKDSIAVKQLTKRLDKYMEKLDALADRKRDDLGFDFEAMGVDYLVVDEAHEFKNLEYATAGERLVGMNDPNGSQRAFDLYVKVRGLLERKGGVSFMTGTPISNSLVEIYTMLKYLAYDDLRAREMAHFDAWSGAYIQAESRFEYTASQSLVARRVMSGLVNLQSLSQLYRSVADIILNKEIRDIYAAQIKEENRISGGKKSEKFPTPKVAKGGRQLLNAPPTFDQVEFTDYLVARMHGIKSASDKKAYAKVDNPLWVLTDARKASIDIRTVDPGASRDPNSKVVRAADQIKRVYDANDALRGTQVVFADSSTPAKTAVAGAKRIVTAALERVMGERAGRAQAKTWMDRGHLFSQMWAATMAKAEEMAQDPATPDARRDELTDYFAKLEDVEATLATADTGFSVYDDLKAALVEKGVPESEIEFIHDHETDDKKKKLFARINEGHVRIIVGSTPKMGAGTNIQKRLVALHHMDAPWRPSDVEQREGRIIRQGNLFYADDPEGFEVEILAYSTKGTSDVVLWQVLERKARSIETFLNGALDAMEEEGGDADSYAEFMAQSTGNPVFRLKLQAEKALTDEIAQTNGHLIAKESATQFLGSYEVEKRRAEKAIKANAAAKVGSIAYDGKKGTVAELEETQQAAQQDYEAKYNAFLVKRDKVDAERRAAEALGTPKADWPALPAAPSRPRMVSDAITAKSGYARAVRAILEQADKQPLYETLPFKVGTMDGEVQRRSGFNDGDSWISVSYSVDGVEVASQSATVKSAIQSDKLIAAFNPAWIAEQIEGDAGWRKSKRDSIEAKKADADKWADREVDTKEREALTELSRYYRLATEMAEAQATLARNSRPNRFIQRDGKRNLSGGDAGVVTDKVEFEIDGETYSGIGLVSGSVHDTRRKSDGKRAFVFAETKDGETRALSVLVEPDRATKEIAEALSPERQLRLRPGDDKALTLDDVAGLIGDIRAEVAKSGLAGKVRARVVHALADAAGVPIQGRQRGAEIEINAAAPVGALGVARHEIIHALRDAALWGQPYGLFTQSEWQGLVRAARADKSLMSELTERYAGQGLTASQMIEEGIAEQYRLWAGRNDGAGALAKAFGKVKAFLTAVANALRGAGFQSAARTFQSIADGDVGGRGPESPNGEGAPRELRLPGKDAARDDTGRFRKATDWARDIPVTAKNWKKDAPEYFSNLMTDAMGGGKWANLLALVPLRPLLTELGKKLHSVRGYLRTKEEMDALRNDWHSTTDEVARAWVKLNRNGREENAKLMEMMHRATLTGIDPSKAFDTERYDLARKRIKQYGRNSPMNDWARDLLADEPGAREAHGELVREFMKLPAEYRAMFRSVAKTYDKMGDDFEEAVLQNIQKAAEVALKRAERAYRAEMERIRDEGMTGTEKATARSLAEIELDKARARSGWAVKSRINGLRVQFESNRLKGPYFPLARFGDYFVTARDKNGMVVSFSRFETSSAQAREADRLRSDGYTVQVGVLSQTESLKEQVDPTFVADIQGLLGDFGADHKLMDAVWQRWLETLPDQSIRTNRIHRKGQQGYDQDALRAFTNHMFHGAHQLARLKYGMDLQEHLDEAQAEARKADDPNRAGLVVNELAKRHEFIMQPTGGPVAARLGALSFIWYLGATPAAAIANLSQTTVVGPAILGGRFSKQGVSGAVRQLARATKDFAKAKGNPMESGRLTGDERAALREAIRRGTIDKTQAHDLASVAETGIEYNGQWESVMRGISWFFHQAEVLNRTATFLAAYRMARADGQPQEEAIQTGADLTWKTHFDYQNTSRPRLMQNDFMKVVTQFRQFTVNMIFRFARDLNQMVKAETPAAKKEARTQFVALTLSMMAHAGIRGVWGYGIITTLLGMFFDGGDDDVDRFLQDALLMENNNIGAAAWNYGMGMVLNGIPGHVTGTDLTNRIGMPNFWFRENDRPLEGEEWYSHMVAELLGPTYGIGEGFARGIGYAADGQWWRGVESTLPKVLRDVLKATRYAAEGVMTKNGDTIVEDLPVSSVIRQALGFTPAEVAERYAANSRMMNRQERIMDDRRAIQREIGTAIMSGEAIPQESLDKMQAFNREYPEYPITNDTIQQSVSSRQRASERNEYGIQLNPRLNDRIRSEEAQLVYGD